MKKIFSIVLCLVMLASLLTLASCGKKEYKIAVVTDVGTLMDKGFNQGTWEGAKAYAEANKISYKYISPAAAATPMTTAASKPCRALSTTVPRSSWLPASFRRPQCAPSQRQTRM